MGDRLCHTRLGFMPAKKVAEFFSVSESTVRKKASTGEWPSYCIGGRRLFDLDELIRIIKQVRSLRSPKGKR